ncbi:hypothetical protein WR25_04347 [Diploscapter pachys]|uniref:Insulin-like domain-containing protein n=1 Tax=Diploscapter pachys TaxID=2018661 RepID=A0A2A2M1R5_9BILA|nr:hypothetical protein WR25_04347 [Diploscapter pachys]
MLLVASRVHERYHSSPPILLLLLFITIYPQRVEGNMRLCGTRLTQTLLAICRNQLCSSFAVFKRAPFWQPESPGELQQAHHTVKRGGIATECCEKRCSLAYLKTYCCPH